MIFKSKVSRIKVVTLKERSVVLGGRSIQITVVLQACSLRKASWPQTHIQLDSRALDALLREPV